MPMQPISTSILICERLLTESDGVMSAIRMVDVFYYTPDPDVPVEKQPIRMSVLARVRISPGDDEEHALQLQIIRPNEEKTLVGEPFRTKIAGKIPGAPRGINIVAQLGVVPKQMGTHYISLLFDGAETARTEFTLVERKAEGSE